MRSHRVRTLHIRSLLGEAIELARAAEGSVLTAGLEEPMTGGDPRTLTLKQLERAINLARHAAAELEDELLVARDGWEQR